MPACGACGSTALVVWTRRPSEAELAAIPAEHGGESATATNTTVAVYACGSHAISADLGALVHQALCAGPSSPALPDCTCTPEPAPVAVPEPVQELPAGWQ
jgi:hypothetical protein